MEFNTQFEPSYGVTQSVQAGVERLTANNPSPFTFYGTNSYLVGTESLAIVDPGPNDDAHFEALMRAIDGRSVSHVFVSHTHRDHSPLAARLKEATGAVTVAEGVHRAARILRTDEGNPLDASADMDFRPDIFVRNGDRIVGDGWEMETVLTPGHTANHAAYALVGSGILFSADHVMAWSTSIVAPPDGSMADYMASLDRLLTRSDRVYLPGHGGPVTSPAAFVRGLKAHRKMRERAILERILAGDCRISDIVRAIYRETDPRLHGAAALSVLAHLEDMVAMGLVQTDSDITLDATYRPG